MAKVNAYAAHSATTDMQPLQIERREVEAQDVQIGILYCGICHSDIHMVRNEWGFNPTYPMVPGHEIIGRVTKIGPQVNKYKVGDLVGVGCMVDSCNNCSECNDSLEQFCPHMVQTYGFADPKHKGINYGGYSQQIVVDERFVLRVPENLDVTAVAPLLCAGITTWSPLKHWNIKKGDVVGIIGLGGLGHMGIKFAHALGAKVIMITTSDRYDF